MGVTYRSIKEIGNRNGTAGQPAFLLADLMQTCAGIGLEHGNLHRTGIESAVEFDGFLDILFCFKGNTNNVEGHGFGDIRGEF